MVGAVRGWLAGGGPGGGRVRAACSRREQRQVEAEGAALAEFALHGDLAAELGGDLAADGQAQAGAAVAAAGGAITLLECGEDAGEVVAADADTSVGHREDNRVPGLRRLGPGHVDMQPDLPAFGELDRVGQ